MTSIIEKILVSHVELQSTIISHLIDEAHCISSLTLKIKNKNHEDKNFLISKVTTTNKPNLILSRLMLLNLGHAITKVTLSFNF